MADIKLPDRIHTQVNTPYLLSRAVAREMPEIEDTVCLQEGFMAGKISAGSKYIKANRYFSDKHFFRLFAF
jgi:hypothetical protein